MTSLSVVIPAWNEQDGIQDIVNRVLVIRGDLRRVGVDDMELIVVDDGSSDRTAERVAECPGVRLIRHRHNGGYGAALKTGFAAAQGEYIGFLDADGTYPPEYFPALCAEALATGADIVIGSRMAGADSRMPAVRRLGNVLFAGLVSLISAQRITDAASGMRIFKRSILGRLYPLPDGLNLTPVMSTRALHERLAVVELSIPYSERVGRSKLSVVHDGVSFAQSIVWTALNYNPGRILGMVGVTCLALAGLIALAVVVYRVRGVTSLSPLGGFSIFAGMVLAVAGVTITALGVSFNYFVALFHKQPVRQGLLGRPLTGVHLHHHFGWVGLLAFLAAVLLGITSLVLGSRGWPVSRLWFYYLASASLALVGIQLMVSWVQMQVLEALRLRDERVTGDLQGRPADEGMGAAVPVAGDLLPPATQFVAENAL